MTPTDPLAHRPLWHHRLAELTEVSVLTEKLLAHRTALPFELSILLDTYHADLAAAIEDKQAEATPPPCSADRRSAASGTSATTRGKAP
jgi:hypothetical protein